MEKKESHFLKSTRHFVFASYVMAVTLSFNPTMQPKIAAISPTIAVRIPITTSEQKKHNHPPNICGGGTHANSTFS
jgi:hypothetical protein